MRIYFETLEQQLSPRDFYSRKLTKLGRVNSSGWASGGLCPFHDDGKEGNFRVNLTSGSFKCFSCGASGRGVVAFEAKSRNLTAHEAAKVLEEEFGIRF